MSINTDSEISRSNHIDDVLAWKLELYLRKLASRIQWHKQHGLVDADQSLVNLKNQRLLALVQELASLQRLCDCERLDNHKVLRELTRNDSSSKDKRRKAPSLLRRRHSCQFPTIHESLERKMKQPGSDMRESFDAALSTLNNCYAQMETAFERHVKRNVCHITEALRLGAKRYLTLDEMPNEWKHNYYILTGYRFYNSKRQCLLSILKCHNETINIWTHLIGFLFIVFLMSYWYPKESALFQSLPYADQIIFMIFLFSALKCLFCSILWHTFCHLAELDIVNRAACLDYSGIVGLIASSIILIEYHGFYCQPISRVIYILSTLVISTIAYLVPWQKWFNDKEYKVKRVLFFLGIAISGALPILHILSDCGVFQTIQFYRKTIISLVCYGVGLVLYAMHIPERLYPGKFDTIGNSHQLWHCATLLGIWYTIKANESYGQSLKILGCPNPR